ncbi:MAG TPA: YciI family protein, partial [Bryobacteraceae bacterium]|nr:YciI family protein [Bryobacteraceae bacterium]
MKYAMMGAEPRAEVGHISTAEQERRIRCHQQALNDLLRARVIAGRTGLIFVSVGLGPFHGGTEQALSVGNRRGKRFRTDGPFPETKEVVGGFDIIDFASRDEAIEFGKVKNMHATHIEEIRPIREFWWISHSPKLAETNIFMLSSVEDGRATSE